MTGPVTVPGPAATAAAPRRGWTLALASVGAFMGALDVVVVSTALPTLRSHFGASLADLEWTINAYSLAFGCLMLTGAALGDRFGRRRMYAAGLLVFVLGSALAALAPSASLLIAARVVQGAGGAVLVPLTLTLISDAFPVEQRGTAIGIWGGVTGLGVAAGPIVGGAIVQGISWQWIFWLNVPVGIVVAVLALLRLRESRGPRPQLDVAGLVLAAAGLFALTWAPVRAPQYGWGSGQVTGALAAGVVLLAAFLAWERRAPYPMLPLGYFRVRAFWTANVVVFLQFVSLIGSLFFITQLFQIGLGYSPLGRPAHPGLDGDADAGVAGRWRARRPVREPAVHARRPRAAGGRPGLAGGGHHARSELPDPGRTAGGVRRGDRDVFPHGRERGDSRRAGPRTSAWPRARTTR